MTFGSSPKDQLLLEQIFTPGCSSRLWLFIHPWLHLLLARIPPKVHEFLHCSQGIWRPHRLVCWFSTSGYVLPGYPPCCVVGFLFFTNCLLRNTLVYMLYGHMVYLSSGPPSAKSFFGSTRYYTIFGHKPQVQSRRREVQSQIGAWPGPSLTCNPCLPPRVASGSRLDTENSLNNI